MIEAWFKVPLPMEKYRYINAKKINVDLTKN